MILGDRTIRIEILEGGEIEIRRVTPEGKTREPLSYDSEDAALPVIEMLLRAARQKALKEKFVPQVVKEGLRELRKMEASRNGGKKF